MKSVSVQSLKKDPFEALKHARDGEVVVVTNRNLPEAILVGFEQLGMPDLGRLRLAIAAALFRDGVISSGSAARIAGKSRAEMLDVLARLGIPLASQDDALVDDVTAIDTWLSRR